MPNDQLLATMLQKAQGIGPTPATPDNGYMVGQMPMAPTGGWITNVVGNGDSLAEIVKHLYSTAKILATRKLADKVEGDFPRTKPYIEHPIGSILDLIKGK